MSAATESTLWHFALVGTPNSGKTALFNAITGSRQKVANYPGVTVERKAGIIQTPAGHRVNLTDLPGTYSLRGRSPDEEITRDIVLGRFASEPPPDLLLCVADATNLRVALRLVIELKQVGRPLMLVLNMIDIARRRGIEIDLDRLSEELGVPVVTSIAVRRGGIEDLLRRMDEMIATFKRANAASTWQPPTSAELRAAQREADRIIRAAVGAPARPDTLTGRVDAVLLHPVAGLVILLGVLFVMFQAVFAWAQPLMDLISAGFDALGVVVHEVLPAGLLQSFIQNGVISGVGSVIVFLPQILILFLFILLLEDFGYMARAAFLMDRIMGGAGLHGRAFIPLLSSFACAIPGHHGDAGDRQPARPADHHPGGAADDLLGAHSGLHADHLRVHPGPAGLGLGRPAGAGDVRPLCRRHRQRARRVVRRQSFLLARERRRRPSCSNCPTTSCRACAASPSASTRAP